MTATFLVSLVFLLANGSPVNKGIADCAGIVFTDSVNDRDITTIDGSLVQLDSRGAMILTVYRPVTITCAIAHQGQVYKGPITLSRHGQVEHRYLKGLQHE